MTPPRSRTTTAVALAAGCTALALGVPAPAGAAATRPIVSGHVSLSTVAGALPVGATLSVVEECPRGSRLDRTWTRRAMTGAELDPHVRLAGREYWVAGTVSRYRVVRATTADTPVALADAVICTGSAPARATTVRGRASSDLRVWGPAPSDLLLVNGTAAVVTDDVEARHYFATVVRAGGVASSRGSLAGALTAVQEVVQQGDVGAVAAVGQTSRRVPRGSFVSMRNSYGYVSDLRRKVTVTEPAP
jgi:hypothetical protein